MMTPRQAYWRLGLVLLIYGLLSFTQSLQLPLHKSSDEIAHFQHARFIAQNGRLPLNYEERAAAGYRSDWPALYHIFTAALTGWSDSDAPPYLKFVWESPRFDLARELLNTKRLANTEDERWPYRGTVLMWHLGRLVSIIFSAGTIVLTFFTALEIFPRNYRLAVMAAAIIAFVPTFVFISSVLSDDSLMGLIGGLYLWVLIKIVKEVEQTFSLLHTDKLKVYPTFTQWKYYIWLGILMGLSASTKYSAAILPVEVIVMLAYLAWRRRWGWRGWFGRVSLVGIMSILASSWWYIFLVVQFNEIAEYGLIVGSLKPLIAGGVDRSQRYAAYVLTGGQIGIADSPEFISEPFGAWVLEFFRSFWVIKIGDYPLGPAAHILIGLVCVITVAGLVRVWQRRPEVRIWIALFTFHGLVFLIFPLVRYAILRDLAQSAQGRHLLFPMATIFPLLLIYGWQAWELPKIRHWIMLIVAGALLLWSLAQLLRVTTYYTNTNTLLPVQTTANVTQQIPHRLDKSFGDHLRGDHLRLVGYDSELQTPQSILKLSLYWQSPTYADEDYRMKVSLVRAGTTHLEWSAYPTNGRYPTRVWEKWETIRDDYWFPLLDLPAGDYEVRLQLYGARGPIPVDGEETLILTSLAIPDTPAIQPDISLPIVVAGREVVKGLTLWQADDYRTLNLPEYRPRMAIPLVWLGKTGPNERVEWLLVDPNGRVYSSQQASAHFEYFIVGLDWPSGDYRLRAEVWRDDSVIASQETAPVVTIINKKPRLLKPPPITHPLEANFDDRLKLLGYNLPVRSLSIGQGVPVVLYWQGLRTMDRSYTVFTKLLDTQHQAWGSADRLPADGYNTIYWLENEVVIDGFELPVDPAIPNGVYWLNVGLYEEIDQTAVSLPLVIDGQRSEITSVTFGPVKVGGPPPGVVVSEAWPEHALKIELGGVIGLRGYDLSRDQGSLRVKLYWESLTQTDTDYTVFMHVKNQAGETVAQMDRPLTDNVYPSSLWSSGEIVPDEVLLPLPDTLPPGEYTMHVGLYDFTTGLRLPVAGSSDDSVLLSEIVID